MTTHHYYLPDTPTVQVTPEVIGRIADGAISFRPFYEEGDLTLTVDTQEFAEFMRKAGHDVTIGYQSWGSEKKEAEVEDV